MTDTAPNSGDRHDVQARVDELPSQMSPDEKAGQLTQHFCVRARRWTRPCLWHGRMLDQREAPAKINSVFRSRAAQRDQAMWSHLPSAYNVSEGDISTALIKYLLGMDQL
jgi:hypothetical protein